MQGISLTLSAKFGHFKRPETSNNPCTFSYMHKCAFVGFMGAVVGIHRDRMNGMYPDLCDDLLYSLELLNPVQKDGVGFTKRKVTPEKFFNPSQRFQEVLRDPSYRITLALKNHRSEPTFTQFRDLIKQNKTHYPVYFGIISCPCNFKDIEEVSVSDKATGNVILSSVISAQHEILNMKDDTELIYEPVPTHMVDQMYTPNRVIDSICPFGPIEVNGEYYLVNGEKAIWMM